MDIAFVHPSYPESQGTGATHSATQIVKGLRSNNHNVDVICTKKVPEKHLGDTGNIELIERDYPSPIDNKIINKRLRDYFNNDNNYDILHSYPMFTLPSLAQISETRDISTVITLNAYNAICPKNDLLYHDSTICTSNGRAKCFDCMLKHTHKVDKYRDRPFINGTVKTPYRIIRNISHIQRVLNSFESRNKIDAYRSPSRHVTENYIKFGFNRDKLYHIPHPTDQMFKAEEKRFFSEPYTLLYVGQLNYNKGADRLPYIMNRLFIHDQNKFKMKIIGDGVQKKFIQKVVSKLDLESRVDVVGFVDYENLPRHYMESDIFVYPSRWEEPFARVLLESLASGTPIVTTDFGYVADMIGDGGKTTEHSIPNICETIRYIVENNELSDMSKSAIKKSREYDRGNVIDGIEDMYGQII